MIWKRERTCFRLRERFADRAVSTQRPMRFHRRSTDFPLSQVVCWQFLTSAELAKVFSTESLQETLTPEFLVRFSDFQPEVSNSLNQFTDSDLFTLITIINTASSINRANPQRQWAFSSNALSQATETTSHQKTKFVGIFRKAQNRRAISLWYSHCVRRRLQSDSSLADKCRRMFWKPF